MSKPVSKAEYVGIDLAWSDRNPTALCSLDGAGRDVGEAMLETDGDIVEWVADRLTDDMVVGIDAPLLVPNETGRRGCEQQVAAEYGGRKAGPHPSNRTLFTERYGRIRGEDLMARFAELGFDGPWSAASRQVVEVYPHPALIEVFGLRERLVYKAKRGVGPGERRTGLRTLAGLLASLETADPPLIADTVEVLDDARGRRLKAIEDTLDARLCAWIASLWGRYGTDRVRLFGDAATGHIAVPVGTWIAMGPDRD